MRLRSLPFWPHSLRGQIMLAIGLALLVGQGISAALIWRAMHERRETMLVNSAAFRLLGPTGRNRIGPLTAPEPGLGPRSAAFTPEPGQPPQGLLPDGRPPMDPNPLHARLEPANPARAGERHLAEAERTLTELLAAQGIAVSGVVMVQRPPVADEQGRLWLERRKTQVRLPDEPHDGVPELVIAGIGRPDGQWLVARIIAPEAERYVLRNLIGQTLLLYLVLVGAVALIVGRIARPLAALTRRVEQFARNRQVDGQLEPSGPEDVRRLIVAHNAMEDRVARLLDEKDVMLGAIGHDLKTPLAALRVRIESVDDDAERAKMAHGIEDIVRSLDDILSLARVGRPSDPLETTDLRALVAAVVEEFEDMGEPVTLERSERIVLPLRATWLRRALRNLVSNAVRYGGGASVSLRRERGAALLCVEDEGPGIPEAEIGRMLEPFTRLEASRNSGTGGTGIGLTLARAIAEQHGGALRLANRTDGKSGIVATISLPLAS